MSIALLLLTTSDLSPYVLYGLLPFVVSGSAVYMAFKAHERNLEPWAWAMVALVVLFNPFVAAPLPREVWQVVQLAAAGVFAVALWRLRRR